MTFYITQLKEDVQELNEYLVELAKRIADMNATNVDLLDKGNSNTELASNLEQELGKWQAFIWFRAVDNSIIKN